MRISTKNTFSVSISSIFTLLLFIGLMISSWPPKSFAGTAAGAGPE
jgi:hypothetical protein